jgi:MOSC domain-containing protein YiiM
MPFQPGSPVQPRSFAELEAGLDQVRAAPKDCGTLVWIACRPAVDVRAVLDFGELDPSQGLVGDNWSVRRRAGREHEPPDPRRMINVMSARAIELIAGEREHWALAGDQLYLDLDVSTANLPPGTRLVIGTAVLQVTEPPHTGCAKFQARFGADALRFVNSPAGKELRLRGFNAQVVQGGAVRRGDSVVCVRPD